MHPVILRQSHWSKKANEEYDGERENETKHGTREESWETRENTRDEGWLERDTAMRGREENARRRRVEKGIVRYIGGWVAVGGCRGWNEILICRGARNPCSRPALVYHFPPISCRCERRRIPADFARSFANTFIARYSRSILLFLSTVITLIKVRRIEMNELKYLISDYMIA